MRAGPFCCLRPGVIQASMEKALAFWMTCTSSLESARPLIRVSPVTLS